MAGKAFTCTHLCSSCVTDEKKLCLCKMRISKIGRTQKHQHHRPSRGGFDPRPKRWFWSSPKRFYVLLISTLAFIALLPPIFLHFRLARFNQMQVRRCGWLNNPPLVCAHGGDSTNAFPNTMAAYHYALRSRVDCMEIDVSRSSDGVLFALHDRQGFAADIQ